MLSPKSSSDKNSQHQHKKESKMKPKKENKPNSVPEIKEVPIVHDEISIMSGDFATQDIKILMLGSGDSGKPILFRQLNSIYIGFKDNEKNE